MNTVPFGAESPVLPRVLPFLSRKPEGYCSGSAVAWSIQVRRHQGPAALPCGVRATGARARGGPTPRRPLKHSPLPAALKTQPPPRNRSRAPVHRTGHPPFRPSSTPHLPRTSPPRDVRAPGRRRSRFRSRVSRRRGRVAESRHACEHLVREHRAEAQGEEQDYHPQRRERRSTPPVARGAHGAVRLWQDHLHGKSCMGLG